MDELLYILITILSLTLVLLAMRLGPQFLIGVVVTLLLTANIFSGRLTVVFGFINTMALPIYAAIFLATDSAAEHFGKKVAYQIVLIGIFAQICMVMLSQMIIRTSYYGDPLITESLTAIFGFLPRIVLGSLVAYTISQYFDVTVYHFLKEKYQGKHLWLRNCLSTTISQGLDSAIFLLIAFYGVLPKLGELYISVWIFKIVIALIDTPFIYLSYWVLGKKFPTGK